MIIVRRYDIISFNFITIIIGILRNKMCKNSDTYQI